LNGNCKIFGGSLEKQRTLFALQLCAYLFLLVSSCCVAGAQVNVYTRSNDNARTGDNLQETILTPANVNATNFGKLFTVPTDGQIYAQPLYVSNLTIAGGTHNVVFVASMRNTVYAVDADSGTVLWSQNYGTPMVAKEVETDENIVWSTGIGILGTPVIDPATNYMYFVSAEEPTGTQNRSFNLNAIDITTGQPVHGSPVVLAATYQTADLTNPLVFNATIHNARPGMALANGNVYIAFASHEDQNDYHGWVLAYSTSTLAQTAVYSDTTSGTKGGIWNAGQSPTIDANGNIYISTGNGSFGTTTNNLVQTGNSFIKLSPTLELLDYFTPYNSANLNSGDQDLGSSGLLLIPNTSYVLGGGKQGVMYLADIGNLGKFNASSDQVRQEFQAVYGNGTSHIHGGPVYYNSDANGPSVYVWGENDKLRGFTFNATTGMLNTTPFATSTMTAPATNANSAMPGGFLSVSANNNQNGILWASTPYNDDAVHHSVEGVLYAFDATTLKLLWTDKTNAARDDVGYFAKYVPPVIANGKMFIPNFGIASTTDGSGNLVGYGLLLPPLTVAVANATMVAGGQLPVLTGTVTGLTNGDAVGTTIIATYSTTATTASPAGTYPITATVTGASAANYVVTVNAGTLTVTAAPLPTLTVSANNAARVYNTANPVFAGTVTGAQNNDTFTETFTTTATMASPVGTYPIVPAVTGPVTNYTVTTVNGTLTVNAAPTATTVTAPASAVSGASVSLSATVTSSAGTPSGNVTFTSGATSLGVAALATGVATLNTTALPAGTDTVTATYTATGNFAGSSGTANLTVTPAATQGSYTVSANPTSLTVQTGKAANTTLTFTPSGSYTGTLALSCSNLPANATCVFAQNTIKLTGNSQSATVGLVINTAGNTAAQSVGRRTPQSGGSVALLALAFWWPGALTGLAVVLRQRVADTPRSLQLCLLLLCAGAFAIGLSGCGGGSMGSSPTTSTSQVTVVATETVTPGVTPQSVVLNLTVTP
jgi:outer membrane protein assembly factor BamB